MEKTPLEAARLAGFIATLSKAEKRYFRELHAAGEDPPVYLEIFEYLEDYPDTDNDSFRQHFAGRDFLRNLSSALYYLEGRLVRTLAQYHRSRFPSLALREELEAAKVLLFRGYTSRALKRLISISQRAKKAADPFILPEALYWKAKAISRDSHSGDMLGELVQAAAERMGALDSLKSAAAWEHRHAMFIQGVFEGGNKDLVERLKAEERWMSETAPDTAGAFEAEYFRLWLQSRIARYQQRKEEGHAYRRQLMELLHESPEWCQMHAHSYATVLTNLCNSSSMMSDEDSFKLAHERLRSIRSLDPDQSKLLRLQSCLAELNHHMEQLDFAACIPVMREAGPAFEAANHLLVKPNEILFLYYFSVACFGNRMHGEALKWMRRLLETTRHTTFLEAHCRVHVLRLAVYHETSNWDQILKVAPKSIEFLRQHAERNPLELELAQFFLAQAKSPSIGGEGEKGLLRDLLERYPSLPEGAANFHFHHLRAWIRSRLEHCSFAEAMRRERDS